jgi:predicted nucleic acid-binding protein
MAAPGPIYLDTSALIKLYLPEPGSDELDRALNDRRDLLVSDLAITEFASAIGRRKRSGALTSDRTGQLYQALLDHATSADLYLRIATTVDAHRLAERFLLSLDSIELRASDALHLALATGEKARSIATFDRRQREAASTLSLVLLP